MADPDVAVIVKTIIALAQSLGLEVTAKGLKVKEPQAVLAQNGCNAFQGYLFSRPLPIDGFEMWLPDQSKSMAGHT